MFRAPKEGLLTRPTTTANIPQQPQSPRISLTIPLHSLYPQPRSSSGQPLGARESASEKGSRRSASAHSVESESSTWIDTGDLAEQLLDAEDPLRDCSLDREINSHRATKSRLRQQRPTRYSSELTTALVESHSEKTSIEIPRPLPRHISRVERFLATIMSPNNRRTAQVHGLVGKPLL